MPKEIWETRYEPLHQPGSSPDDPAADQFIYQMDREMHDRLWQAAAPQMAVRSLVGFYDDDGRRHRVVRDDLGNVVGDEPWPE